MQPIYARLQGTGMNNKINSYMDHVWDGFYTGQVRQSRFPILVYAPTGAVYDIVYTGSPAKKMKYALNSQDPTLGLTVRIAYPSAQSRQILLDGKRVDMNQWDETERMYGSIKQDFCGENRYIGVKNILEFYITAGCTLEIKPRDAIQTMVRLEWTMNEFFAGGGTTQFIDRVAGSLGIHASTIKVVSVYDGSLVINYDIEPEEDEDDTADNSTTNGTSSGGSTGGSSGGSTQSVADKLAAIKAKQIEAFSTGSMDLGAPVSDVELAVSVAEPDPPENTTSSSNSSSNSSSSSDGSSSSSDDSTPQKIITGG